MTRIRLAGSALLVLAVLGCEGASVRRFIGDRYLARAESLIRQKQLEQRAAALRSAIAWDPGRSEASRSLATTLLDLQTLTGDPDTARRRLAEAISACLRAIAADPADAEAWGLLSDAYERVRPAGSGAIDLGAFLAPSRERLRPELAIALSAVDRALELEPNGYEYLDQRAALLMRAGLRQEALADYRRSAEVMPRALAHAWDRPERLEEDVAEAIREGLVAAVDGNRLQPREEMLRGVGEWLIARGRYAEAEGWIVRAAEAARDRRLRAILRQQVADVLRLAGKTDQAFDLYAEGLKDPDVAPAALARRGEILIEKGRMDEAFSSLRQAVALRPADPRVRLALARAALATGRENLGVDSLEAAARLLPQDPEPLLQLLRWYEASGDTLSAEETVRRLEEGWPSHPEVKRRVSG